MKIGGHRGAKGESDENTLSSIKRAFYAGADIVEIDVRYTKDRVPVLFHDENIDRTTFGNGKIQDFTYRELLEFNSFIPTLKEALELIKDYDIELFIEIKVPGNEKYLFDLVKNEGLIDRVMFGSFNHRIVHTLLAVCDVDIRTFCILSSLPINPIHLAIDAGACGLSFKHDFVDSNLVQQIHTNGLKIMVWTVNDDENFRKFKDFGVDYLLTDYPSIFT